MVKKYTFILNIIIKKKNKNKTKYIEKLIREDLISRNMIKNNFIE